MNEPVDQVTDREFEVPISALEHFSYCPRQCALIHVDQIFEENLFTIQGKLAHERVDSGEETARRGVRIMRGVPLWSDRLGLFGKADAVEFSRHGPYPVEYKVGRRRGPHADLQVCAQALCLEEMLQVPVPRGAVFYWATRQRLEIDFDQELRLRTVTAIEAVRQLLEATAQRLPPAPNDHRCRNCSLVDACLPTIVGEPARVRGLQGALFRPLEARGDDG